jgi:hypothetical protein
MWSKKDLLVIKVKNFLTVVATFSICDINRSEILLLFLPTFSLNKGRKKYSLSLGKLSLGWRNFWPSNEPSSLTEKPKILPRSRKMVENAFIFYKKCLVKF